MPGQQDRLHPAMSYPRRPGTRAQEPLCPGFCSACCSTALPPSCSLWERTKRARGCGGQRGKWSDGTTLKSTQHCTFLSISMFNWSALCSNPSPFPEAHCYALFCPSLRFTSSLEVLDAWKKQFPSSEWKLAAGQKQSQRLHREPASALQYLSVSVRSRWSSAVLWTCPS